MCVLPSSRCVPQMNESVQGKKCRASLRRWPGCGVNREPEQPRSGHQISNANIAYEMRVE
jgi:hypothetical protein